jgi:integrase
VIPELDRLYADCDKMYINQKSWKDAILLSTESALRSGEQLALLWSDIELATRCIHVRKEMSKTKKYRDVPMTSPVYEMLKQRLAERKQVEQGEQREFPEWSNSNALARRFKVIVKNAGLGDYKWHDNRHYTITNLFLKTSIKDMEIAAISGHFNMTTLRRYTHLRSEELYKKLW